MSKPFSLHEYFHKVKSGTLKESVNEEDYDRERDARAMGYTSAAEADRDNWGMPKKEPKPGTTDHDDADLDETDEMLDHPGEDNDPADEIDETDFSKYDTVEEMMKDIEKEIDEAALKNKMEKVKRAYESLEQKAISLEEGEHSEYISKSKIKEMKKNAKKLRKMHEKYEKTYEKKYNKEEKKPKKKEKAYEGVTSSTLKNIIKEEINRQSTKIS